MFFIVFQWLFSISNNTLVVPWLETGTAYCVSAQIRVTTPRLDSGFSKEHCITTLKGMCEVANLKKKCKLEKIMVIVFVSFFMYLFWEWYGFSLLCALVSMKKTLPLIKHSWDWLEGTSTSEEKYQHSLSFSAQGMFFSPWMQFGSGRAGSIWSLQQENLREMLLLVFRI